MGELIDGIVYRVPAGIVFAVVRGVRLVGQRSPSWLPSAVLGVLAALEFLLVVFVFSRGEDPAAWWRLVLYGALSLVVAVLSAVDLLVRSPAPKTPSLERHVNSARIVRRCPPFVTVTEPRRGAR